MFYLFYLWIERLTFFKNRVLDSNFYHNDYICNSSSLSPGSMSPEIASDTDAQTVSDRRRNSGGSQSEKLQRKKVFHIRSSIPSSSDDSLVIPTYLGEKVVGDLSSRKGSSGYAHSSNSEKISEKSSCISQKFASSCKNCKNSNNNAGLGSGSSHFEDDICDCCCNSSLSVNNATGNGNKGKYCENVIENEKKGGGVGVVSQNQDQLKAQLEMLRAEKLAWMQEREQLLAKLRKVNITANFDSDDVEMV